MNPPIAVVATTYGNIEMGPLAACQSAGKWAAPRPATPTHRVKVAPPKIKALRSLDLAGALGPDDDGAGIRFRLERLEVSTESWETSAWSFERIARMPKSGGAISR